ncbi:phosphonate C-P lyase system protein PhnH [Enterococcus sp. AZ196]|uniref:phosphonate C-P lyase system protein PhnH n=1 Tax=Enterococcus sp. AZ196 TaxID=2774659 RepID=UPI003D2BB979
MIHETQQVFRTLVQLNSYVGERGRLEGHSFNGPISQGAFLIAATLLDQEVSFSVLGMEAEQENYLQQEFRSFPVKIAEADFIFVGKKVTAEQLTALQQAKIGDLIDPQKSATIIVELESLSEASVHYQLEGPGIKERKSVDFPKQLVDIFMIREQLNQEYPLGVDLIIVDEQLEILCIPRTTLIKEVA